MRSKSFRSGTRRTRKAADRAKAMQKRADRRTLANTDHLVWLTVKQAAAWYEVSETTVRRRMDDGTYETRLSPDARTRQVLRTGV